MKHLDYWIKQQKLADQIRTEQARTEVQGKLNENSDKLLFI